MQNIYAHKGKCQDSFLRERNSEITLLQFQDTPGLKDVTIFRCHSLWDLSMTKVAKGIAIRSWIVKGQDRSREITSVFFPFLSGCHAQEVLLFGHVNADGR